MRGCVKYVHEVSNKTTTNHVAESNVLGKIDLCLHNKIKISVGQGFYTGREVMTNTDRLNITRIQKFRSCSGLGLWLGFRTKKTVQNFHR